MPSPQEKADAIYAAQRSKPIIASIIGRIDDELSSILAFHHARHTESVLREAILFAVHDGLPNEDIDLLSLAAAFHDSGHLIRRQDHEILSAQIAEEQMIASGSYSKEQREIVASMILDTVVHDLQSNPRRAPNHRLAAYLLDADLGNFGRDDFWDCTESYRVESKQPGDVKYYSWLLNFMENHQWITPAAKKLRTAKEHENREMLKAKIAQLNALEK